MFFRFAVAFLEHSKNFRFIRGKKKKRPWTPENKKHESETVYCVMRIGDTSVPPLDDLLCLVQFWTILGVVCSVFAQYMGD